MDSTSWSQLVNLTEFVVDRFSNDNLRQDMIEYGIQPSRDFVDLYCMQPLAAESNFDIFAEYSNKIYLTDCLFAAYKINSSFQQAMKSILSKITSTPDGKRESDEYEYILSRAPVKTYDRCIVKSQVDYKSKAFPNISHILDFVRCSIEFKSVALLLKTLNKFIDYVNDKNESQKENDNSGCEIIEILRLKNGFGDILNWKSVNDCQYCDVKLNVLIVKDNNISMIGEIQFLLKWVSVAKKMGHKYYSIVRKEDFIYDCNNLLKNDLNYELYSSKIESMIKNNQVNNLSVELFLSPNVVLSMILGYYHGSGGRNCFVPILYIIGQESCETFDLSMFQLFLSSIYHFSQSILGMKQKNSLGKKFLIEYLNFNYGKRIIYETKFWGLNVGAIEKYCHSNNNNNNNNNSNRNYSIKEIEFGEKSFSMIESLIANEYYHGMSEKNIGDWGVFLQNLDSRYGKTYLNLLLKYVDKTKRLIKWELESKRGIGHQHTLYRVLRGIGYDSSISGDECIERFNIIFKACQLTNAVIPKVKCERALKVLNTMKRKIEEKENGSDAVVVHDDDYYDDSPPALHTKKEVEYCVETIEQHMRDHHT